jgi:hypothetical protein
VSSNRLGARASRGRAAAFAALCLLFGGIAVLATGCGDAETTASDANEATTTGEGSGEPPLGPGLSLEPTSLDGTEVVVRGRLDGVVADAAGNALGTDAVTGTLWASAPHGSFDSTGEGGQFFLRTAGPHRGSWTALEADEVRFVVRNHAESRVQATVATLPFTLMRGARVSLALTAPADLESVVLAVDDDADGATDRKVPFGEPLVGDAASDMLSPVSVVEIEHPAEARGPMLARVTITATDRGAAGIARVDYALVASGKAGEYTGPFDAPAVGRIVVRAIDRAGNVEAPYQRVSLSP